LAIYHCSVKVIGRSSGRSATGAAAYRSGEKIVDERSGLTHDYTRKTGIDHTEILAPENAPAWVFDRSDLWNHVELCEKRKDSQLCREVEVALPIELTPEQNKELVKGFIQDEFISKGMVADLAIHHAENENPHAHILLTTRSIDHEGFGKKNRDWNQKELLESWRKSWEVNANRALEREGFEERIDRRTLKDQGIERIPQIHVGPKVFEMEKRGVRTERGQRASDIIDANEKIISLEKYKESIEHERTIEHETSQNERGVSQSDRAASEGARDIERSNHRTDSSTAASEQGALRELDSSANSNSRSMDASSQESQERSPSDVRRHQSNHTDCEVPEIEFNSHESDDNSHRYASAFERILALVPNANHNGEKRRDMDGNSPEKLDRTYLAVRRQLNALKCDSYDIGIKNSDGKMMTRTWTKDETLKSVSWLKRENAKGADIYVRPAGEKNQGILLVDDLNQAQLKRMKSQGYEPAAVIETSPHNHQAWVRLSNQPIDSHLATAISKGMAHHFDADQNSADWRHFGRLAGFTNQKPEHRTAQGRSPWVLCHESNGRQASRGDQTVQTIEARLEERSSQILKENSAKRAVEADRGALKQDPIPTYQKELKTLRERFGADMDLSRADFMICSKMLKAGYTKNQLFETLKQASPELQTRKASHQDDYCKRTVEAVQSKHIEQRQARSQEQDLGR